MPPVVLQLTNDHADAVVSVWQAALDARRVELGLTALPAADSAIERPDAFGVGVFDGPRLVSIAVAMPARGDDARSDHNVPGLVHISSVATHPDFWGKGLAALAVVGVQSQAMRRGYARAQLWTHSSNARARRLYERLGFMPSGRDREDDHGEPIVHFIRRLPEPDPRFRRAARVVCLDPDDRVLLMHWRDDVDGHQLWEPPGGGMRHGESVEAAVLREWLEETSLPAPRLEAGPTLVARDVLWRGHRFVTDEHFVLGRVTSPGDPRPDGLSARELAGFLGHFWVAWQDLEHLDDSLEPDLLPVLRRLAPDGPWAVVAT